MWTLHSSRHHGTEVLLLSISHQPRFANASPKGLQYSQEKAEGSEREEESRGTSSNDTFPW